MIRRWRREKERKGRGGVISISVVNTLFLVALVRLTAVTIFYEEEIRLIGVFVRDS